MGIGITNRLPTERNLLCSKVSHQLHLSNKVPSSLASDIDRFIPMVLSWGLILLFQVEFEKNKAKLFFMFTLEIQQTLKQWGQKWGQKVKNQH